MERELELRTARRPNVIWAFGDQHRAQALGYRGDPNLRTPNLDNLARHGMRFDCAVAGAPWCSPYRASLLTGRYPCVNGVTATPGALDPSVPTLAAPLHLPGCETDSLTDLFLGHLVDHVRNTDGGGGGGYQPFFAALSVQPPHGPYVAPTNPPCPATRVNPADIALRPNVPHAAWVREAAAMDLVGYYGMIEDLDWLLHSTADDPYEMANLAYDRSFAAQRRRCHARLARWIEETGDAFELPPADG